MVSAVLHQNAIVGVSDHNGWAVLVSLSSDGAFLDRRRIELVDASLPKLPHHHEGQWAQGRTLDVPWARAITLPDALRLIEQVRTSANEYARKSLEALREELPMKVSKIALRQCPTLPATVEEQLSDYRAQTVADSVMYREALAAAATSLGWEVHWYDRKTVIEQACKLLGVEDLGPLFARVGASVGPPWQVDHRYAMAAAIVAGG